MSDSKNKCKGNETSACCCVDVGTIIDNDDCSTEFKAVFPSEELAQKKLAVLSQTAREVESEPCQIKSKIEKVADGYELTANFHFSCGSECLIFQLRLR